jgi:hypothetical protein
MVGVPEGLERLLSDAVVSRGVHKQHAEKHDMAGEAARLSVVDLNRRHRTNLSSLDIEEAVPVSESSIGAPRPLMDSLDVVGRGMEDGVEEHGIGQLPMEPDVLV